MVIAKYIFPIVGKVSAGTIVKFAEFITPSAVAYWIALTRKLRQFGTARAFPGALMDNHKPG